MMPPVCVTNKPINQCQISDLKHLNLWSVVECNDGFPYPIMTTRTFCALLFGCNGCSTSTTQKMKRHFETTKQAD